MLSWVRRTFRRGYERLLRREIGDGPSHVAVIQDGNRRYARRRGDDATDGYSSGAQTTEQMLEWCEELGVDELTLYAFSTENFDRPEAQQRHLFDLLESKLREFADADRVHERGVCIRALGDLERLPRRVREAVGYAERRTADHDRFRLNVAIAYGGRAELLSAARDVAREVDAGALAPEDVDLAAVEDRLYSRPVRDVDLIIRTGGDERTSNFLPWHANGNEAAVYFCAPYWPEFSKVDFLRGLRTYEARERSWRRTRVERAAVLVRALAAVELTEARAAVSRLRRTLPAPDVEALREELDTDVTDADPGAD